MYSPTYMRKYRVTLLPTHPLLYPQPQLKDYSEIFTTITVADSKKYQAKGHLFEMKWAK